MNFSQAVKRQLTRSGAIKAIQSQAETELGRKLNPEEATSLWCTGTSPHALLEGIQKVKNKLIFLFMKIVYFITFCWISFFEVYIILIISFL